MDGAAGAGSIGVAGGVVLVQDQATSRSFSMPAATIATGQVDAVLTPAEIAAALVSLAGLSPWARRRGHDHASAPLAPLGVTMAR